MCGPIHQEHEIQQAPVPITVQERPVQAQAVQQEQQAVQQEQQAVQQEQQQAGPQVQDQVQPQQPAQRPAAPADAAVAQTQHKKKTERIAPVTRKQVRGNFSDVRKNAFQENLMDNVRMDAAVHDSEPYRAAMGAIRDYASMDLEKTSTDKQSAALAEARLLLRAHPAVPDAPDEESVVINRYRLYFDTFTDGQLTLPQDLNKESHIDYSQKEITRTSIVAGIKPSWADVRDQPLFAHEPSANDIQQRLLGDCYLQAAVSSLVRNAPEKLKECLRDNGDGTVTVRFFKKGYDLMQDLPLSYQKKAEETDAAKLTDQDLLVRLFVDWNKESRRERSALNRAYSNRFTQIVQELKAEQAYIDQAKALEEQRRNETDPMCKATLKQQSDDLAQRVNKQAEEKTGLCGLVAKIDMSELPRAEALAARLCADPDFAPVLEAIRQARNSGQNVMGVLTAAIQNFDKAAPLMQRLRTDEPDLFTPPHGGPAMHPVYVTVQKTVPRVAGVDAYAANCLWMQMIEKAYAASGLHIEKIEDRKADLRTYEQIQGGYSGKFLETLTGMSANRLEQNVITPVQDNLQSQFSPLFQSDGQEQMRQLGIDSLVRTMVQDGLLHELKSRFVRSYTVTENNQQDTKPYATSALTIEDIRGTIMDWRHWAKLSQTEATLALIKQSHSDFDTFTDEHMRKIADFLEDYYANLKAPTLGYRRFAQKEDGTPKYTYWALQQYEAIRVALQASKPVSIGTERFIPKEVQGHGLNGESLAGGLVQGHAYSVTGCEEIDGRKYITLRNPWARFERNYVKVTETDGSVHYEVQENTQGLFAQSDNSGTFHMELNDFMGNVNHIYING